MSSIREPEEPWTEKRTLGRMMHRRHDGRSKESHSTQYGQQHSVILRTGIDDVVTRTAQKDPPLKHDIADSMIYPRARSANASEGDYVDI